MPYVNGWDADTPKGLEQQYRTLAAARLYMKGRTSKTTQYNDFVRGYYEATGDMDHIIHELWYKLYKMDPDRARALRDEFKDEKGNWK